MARKPTDPEHVPFELLPGITLPAWRGVNKQGSASNIDDAELRIGQNIRPSGSGYSERPGLSKFTTAAVGSIEGIFEFSDIGAKGDSLLWPDYEAPIAPCIPVACTQGASVGDGTPKLYYGGNNPFSTACACGATSRSTLAFYDPAKSGSMNAGTFTFPLADGIGVEGLGGRSQGRLVAFEGAIYWVTSSVIEGFPGCAVVGPGVLWLARTPQPTGVLTVPPVAILTPIAAEHCTDALVVGGKLWLAFDTSLYGGPQPNFAEVWTFDNADGFNLEYHLDSTIDYPAAAGYIHAMLATDDSGRVFCGFTGDHVNNIYKPLVRDVTNDLDIPVGVNFNVGIGKGAGAGGGSNYSQPYSLGPWGVFYDGDFYMAGNEPSSGAIIYKLDSLGSVSVARNIGTPAPIVDPLKCTVSQIFVHGGDMYYVIWGSKVAPGAATRVWIGKYDGAVWNDAHHTFPGDPPFPTQMLTYGSDIVLLGTDLVSGAGPRSVKATNASLTTWAQFIPGSGGTCVLASYNYGAVL